MAAEAPRRRPRRGSLERPVSTRIYRAAWLVVAVPVLVAAFSVGRPDALPAPRTQPFFDEETAVQFADGLVTAAADRVAGHRRTAQRRRVGRESARELRLHRRTADVLGRHPRPGHGGAREHRRDRAAHRAGECPGAAGDRRARAPRQPGRLAGRGRQRLRHRRPPRARPRPRQRVALAPDRPRLDRRRRLRGTRGRAFRPEPAATPAGSRRSSTSTRSAPAARRASSSPPIRRACRARRSWPPSTSPSRRKPASSRSAPERSPSSSTSPSRSASSSRRRSSPAAFPP